VLRNDETRCYDKHFDGCVLSVAISPLDQRTVLSGDGSDHAYLWDLHTGVTRACFTSQHTDSVVCTSFSHDGVLCATGGMDGSVCVYAVATGELLRKLEGPSADIEWIEWHARGPLLAAGSADHTVWLWNAKSGDCMRVFAGHIAPVTCGRFTNDGKMLITGSEDATVHVWDPKSGQSVLHIDSKHYHSNGIICLDAHVKEPVILTGGVDNACRFANIQNGKVLAKFEHDDSVECVQFCATDSGQYKFAASGSMDGMLKIWDLKKTKLHASLKHADGVTRIQWNPTNPFLIFSASVDRVLRMWDARSAKCVREWHGHLDTILEFAVTKDAQWIVSGSDDCTCMVFPMDAKQSVTSKAEAKAAAAALAAAASSSSSESKDSTATTTSSTDGTAAAPAAAADTITATAPTAIIENKE
jgi:ribosome assembly protein SQT1